MNQIVLIDGLIHLNLSQHKYLISWIISFTICWWKLFVSMSLFSRSQRRMRVIPEREMKSQVNKDDINEHICSVIMNKMEFRLKNMYQVNYVFFSNKQSISYQYIYLSIYISIYLIPPRAHSTLSCVDVNGEVAKTLHFNCTLYCSLYMSSINPNIFV